MPTPRVAFVCALLAACNSESPSAYQGVGRGGSGGTAAAGTGSGGQSSGGSPALGGAAALGGAVGALQGGSGAQAAGAMSGGVSRGGSAAGGANEGGSSTVAGNAGTAGRAVTMGGSGGALSGLGSPIDDLKAHLAIERSKRPPLADQPFASVGLDKAQAETARGLLWEDHVGLIRATRKAETDAKSISIDNKAMRYDFKVFGSKPANGRSLFISLHGGGEAAASVNDQQWDNQKQLYEPDEGVYLAPRAPTNTWNLWHEAHIDALLWRLIEDLIVFQEVNPNRVYVMGYSAGGDGVYQLGPRMADSWAAAAMMAGHPNDAKPDSLRNIGFTIHVGGLDTAFDRNLIAKEWDTLLDTLEAQDPGSYAHVVEVHPNKPHWMDLEDAVAVPWMAGFTRDPLPKRVVWLQDDVPHQRFYWLAVAAEQAKKATKIVGSYQGQAVTLAVEGVPRVKVRFSDSMLDLDQPVTITEGSAMVFTGKVPRTIKTLATTLAERGDPALVFSAEVEVETP